MSGFTSNNNINIGSAPFSQNQVNYHNGRAGSGNEQVANINYNLALNIGPGARQSIPNFGATFKPTYTYNYGAQQSSNEYGGGGYAPPPPPKREDYAPPGYPPPQGGGGYPPPGYPPEPQGYEPQQPAGYGRPQEEGYGAPPAGYEPPPSAYAPQYPPMKDEGYPPSPSYEDPYGDPYGAPPAPKGYGAAPSPDPYGESFRVHDRSRPRYMADPQGHYVENNRPADYDIPGYGRVKVGGPDMDFEVVKPRGMTTSVNGRPVYSRDFEDDYLPPLPPPRDPYPMDDYLDIPDLPPMLPPPPPPEPKDDGMQGLLMMLVLVLLFSKLKGAQHKPSVLSAEGGARSTNIIQGKKVRKHRPKKTKGPTKKGRKKGTKTLNVVGGKKHKIQKKGKTGKGKKVVKAQNQGPTARRKAE